MTRTQTMVQLTDELVELLDGEAQRRGLSRSAVVREAVAAYLKEAGEARITQLIVSGYTRLPQSTPDEWGSLEDVQDRSTREVLERLDAEEREAKVDPW